MSKPDFSDRDRFERIGTVALRNYVRFGELTIHTDEHTFHPDHFDTYPLEQFDAKLYVTVAKGAAPWLRKN